MKAPVITTCRRPTMHTWLIGSTSCSKMPSLDWLSPVQQGATWTTDAPFRETTFAVAQAQAAGIIAVEMEAAALYAFAQARQQPVVCFAHVTNQMGTVANDFEKGHADGAHDALAPDPRHSPSLVSPGAKATNLTSSHRYPAPTAVHVSTQDLYAILRQINAELDHRTDR